MRIAIYQLNGNNNAMRTTTAMFEGALAIGATVSVCRAEEFEASQVDQFDVACFWGFVQLCQNIFGAYRSAGKPVVYLDAGYWVRSTHYKVSVNARHPTAYFKRARPPDRRVRFGVDVKPNKYNGEHILVAAMSPKSAWAEKVGTWGVYEHELMKVLQELTDRPIILRIKGTVPPPRMFIPPNVTLSFMGQPLHEVMQAAWAVVTHHSNVAVDGLVSGVPAFAYEGVAAPVGTFDLGKIETPVYCEDRAQWANDVAYCQWSIQEMKSGRVWRHLKEEGLV